MLKTTILLIFLFCLTEQISDKELNEIGETCLKQTGMKKKMVVYYRDTQNFPKYDKTYNEFLTCSYKKQGYQNENGDILFENLKKFLVKFYTADEVDVVLAPCKLLKGKTHGENAFFVMRCIITNLKILEADTNETTTLSNLYE